MNYSLINQSNLLLLYNDLAGKEFTKQMLGAIGGTAITQIGKDFYDDYTS